MQKYPAKFDTCTNATKNVPLVSYPTYISDSSNDIISVYKKKFWKNNSFRIRKLVYTFYGTSVRHN